MKRVEEKFHDPRSTDHSTGRKGIVLGLLILLTVGAFGFTYFRAVQSSWRWPIAIVLALCWGAVAVWILRRSCPSPGGTPKPGEHDEEGKHV